MPARPMDPRTRRSRSALEGALRELIAERDLSQISVSDITKRAGGPPDNPLPDLFAHVAEHAALYRALLGDDGSARVINHLLQRMTVTAHIRRAPAPEDPAEGAGTPHDPAAAFVAGAVLGSVVDWLRHDCPGTPQEMGAALWPLLIGIAAAAGWETERPGSPTAGPGHAPSCVFPGDEAQ
jgi:AcrR family transcriptional regulator